MARFRRIALMTVGVFGLVNAVSFGSSFGAVAPSNLSGTVYHDLNNDGVRGRSEPGIPGLVIAVGNDSTVTGSRGQWNMTARRGSTVEVMTGWYRTQCDEPTCAAGPGRDQDFKSQYQSIQAKVGKGTSRLDVGLVPDWRGKYPIPAARPIPSNKTDVSLRISYTKPTGTPGDSNCFRTNKINNRACAIGDQPTFRMRIYNEGTTPIANPRGHLVLPVGTELVSLHDVGTNRGVFGKITYGAFDTRTRSIPFSVTGSLPVATAASYDLTLLITAEASITKKLQTNGTFPVLVGARITNVSNDAEGKTCKDIVDCRWGVTDRQVWPDNSDRAGFAVVAGSSQATTTTAPAPTTIPTTTPTATTPPPTTTPPTTAPQTTVPPTTAPPTTAPPTTAPPTTAPPTTAPPTIPPPTIPPPTTPPPTTVPPSTTVPPTTVPPTTTTPPPGCSVSALLVPSCGVWLGSSTPPRNGGGDVAVGLAEYEAVAQNTPDILHYYKSGGGKFPTAKEIGLAERPGKQRSLLLYNWKPSRSATWRQIADGAVDADIAKVAAGLKSYPHKLFLNIFHEPEDNVNTSPGSGMTPDDYSDMYRHVVDELKSHGVTNAVYVWNVMGYYGWADYLDALYPGNSYVDWVCGDPYAKDDKREDIAELINKPRENLNWPGFYEWATAKAPGKPIMLCEWGVDLKTNSDPGSILQGNIAQMLAQYPMIKAMVYWNSVDVVNARIDDTTAKGEALGASYRNFAGQSIFNRISPSQAP